MATLTCNRYRGEPVETVTQTLTNIRTTIKPKFRTLISKSKDRRWCLCPCCDVYALGLERNVGVPLHTRDGRMTDIHDIETERKG